jgi:predicted methyltransferase MtxX (methanogen marker protein 4)
MLLWVIPYSYRILLFSRQYNARVPDSLLNVEDAFKVLEPFISTPIDHFLRDQELSALMCNDFEWKITVSFPRKVILGILFENSFNLNTVGKEEDNSTSDFFRRMEQTRTRFQRFGSNARVDQVLPSRCCGQANKL